VRVQEEVLQREGGAGPAEAGTLIVNGIPVSVPMSSAYVSQSPYHIQPEGDQTLLLKNGKELLAVGLVSKPKFYDFSTEDDVPYSKIALLHGRDCLATTVVQTCIYWHSKQRCRFCGIELSLENAQTIQRKTPGQLSQVARKAVELDSVRHVVLTTGTERPPGKEIRTLANCTRAIKEATALPVHAQFQPPVHLEAFHELREAGVDTVGIHVESFDLEILSKVAPAKAAIGLKKYKETWKMAVDLFGPNQVSSFLVAGLGEQPDSVISGSEVLADLGVYPFVVPLRPIPGSLMEDALPPEPQMMKWMYEKVAVILSKKGLSASQCAAGCVRCGACSALPWYEQPVHALTCYPARTRAELGAAFKVREKVFVREQKLFEYSDMDDNDSKSVHLVAKQNDEVVGTVRVFPAGNGNGHWIGGRLAVKKGYRSSGAGELLVQNAVACVKKNGCTRFTAHIQEENVTFFSRLGWKDVGEVEECFGRAHQLMEADLHGFLIDN